MRNFLLGMFVSSIAVVSAEGPLSSVQALKVEVQQLKEQLLAAQLADARCRAAFADTTARLDSFMLQAQNEAVQTSRKELEAELRASLGATDKDELDWTTSPPSLKRKQ